jgi:hypothetical protein
MGHYKGEPVRIHVDNTVKPIALPCRRIPFHVRKQVEKKIEQLENEGIVERARRPYSLGFIDSSCTKAA